MDGQLQVAQDDPGLLVVPGGIAGRQKSPAQLLIPPPLPPRAKEKGSGKKTAPKMPTSAWIAPAYAKLKRRSVSFWRQSKRKKGDAKFVVFFTAKFGGLEGFLYIFPK